MYASRQPACKQITVLLSHPGEQRDEEERWRFAEAFAKISS
jgi:hypothetical protein